MESSPTRAGQSSEGLIVAFIVIISATALTAALGGLVSAGEADPWYRSLDLAPGNPPGFVFGIVWPALYALMAIGACMVWRTAGSWKRADSAMGLYFIQLVLNLGWSGLFFGLHQPLIALVDIVILWVLVLATILEFRRHDRRAALLQYPYLAWISFATYLNAWIVFFN